MEEETVKQQQQQGEEEQQKQSQEQQQEQQQQSQEQENKDQEQQQEQEQQQDNSIEEEQEKKDEQKMQTEQEGEQKEQEQEKEEEKQNQVQQVQNSSSQIKQQSLYFFGSAECDQYCIEDLGEDDEMAKKRPYQISYFSDRNIYISKLVCGGLHTVALSTQGDIYTWGCNDSHALGRDTPDSIANISSTPERVPFPGNYKFDLISAGDSHTACANSKHNLLFQWGNCRDAKGEMFQPKKVPERLGEKELAGKNITKIASGANHLFILASQVLFAWGDPETSVLGRKPTSRHKSESLLRIESIQKHVEDVWTGAYHGFLKKYRNKKNEQGETEKISHYYAWGLNNWGQLGIGSDEIQKIFQTEIDEFRGKNITQIVGGEHHSLALEDDGQIYVWGKNDDGQLGLGENIEDYGVYSQEEISNMSEEEKKKKRVELRKPHKVQIKNKDGDVMHVKQVLAGSNFSYVFTKDEDYQLFSWGIGDNYVLGSRGENTKYKPFNLFKDKILMDEDVQQIAVSSQHVCYITSDDFEAPQLDEECIKNGLPEEMFESCKPKPTRGKKAQQQQQSQKSSQEKTEDKQSKSKIGSSKKGKGGKKPLADPLDMKDVKKSLKNIKKEKK